MFLYGLLLVFTGRLECNGMEGASVPTSESIQRTVAGETEAPFSCASNITPKEAWSLLEVHPQAQLVDVRTAPEWAFVGLPDLSSLDKRVITLSWRVYPEMNIDPSFSERLNQFLNAAAVEKTVPLLFLCKTGGRSAEAAGVMAANGWEKCYNIECGFDGEMNASGQRGTINGWKHEELPWRQA